MPLCHFIGGNYWVLKTTYQNRGIGIHVFRTLQELGELINQYVREGEESSTENVL
jgi:hypothetical protein